MDIAITILFLGILIFLGNIFTLVFTRTKIPDLLFLIGIGLIIGPVLGIVSPESFGIVGPIFTIITLAIILFEGGLHLRIETIRQSFTGTIELCLVSFVVSMLLATAVLYYSGLLTFLPALMLGAIIGGTSSAVVIPMIDFLNVRKETGAILALESAITDVLCIVTMLTILDVYLLGTVDLKIITGRLFASFFMAVFLGVLGGVIWSAIYHRLGNFKSIFLTPAYLFIIYGIIDMLGYSGAIAALAFGVTLGNLDSFRISQFFPSENNIAQVELTPSEKMFFAQLVSLLKTFFFIYIGLSIEFTSTISFLAGIGITLALFAARIVIVHVSIPRTTPVWDASVIAVMIPKGLAAAVLAAIPLQMGVVGGEFIETTTYAIILFSIVICSILVLLLERTPFRKLYGVIFKKFGRENGQGGSQAADPVV
ncbi:MAG: cation:proton antiporter [Methanoregula sp.]|nr:MAG: cation:proton antiporter [Methanoregula sp.]